jgi:hypothetical protein
MRVVEVDAVGLQALEQGVRLALDRLRAQLRTAPRPAADLRGHDQPVAIAALGHPAPDDRLRAAVLDQVGVRGVDEVAAPGDVRVEDGARLRIVGRPAEDAAAQAGATGAGARTK